MKKLLLILGLLLTFGFTARAQTDLRSWSMSEIMRAWNQAITDTLVHGDTLYPGDTVTCDVIPIFNMRHSRAQYWSVMAFIDTVGSGGSVGFDGWFKSAIMGYWAENYDTTNRFITTTIDDAGDTLIWPLTNYGGDSLLFQFWTADTCVPTVGLWQVY